MCILQNTRAGVIILNSDILRELNNKHLPDSLLLKRVNNKARAIILVNKLNKIQINQIETLISQCLAQNHLKN